LQRLKLTHEAAAFNAAFGFNLGLYASAKLTAAATMCNPFDCMSCDVALETGFFGTVYSRAMAKNMRALFTPHKHLFAGGACANTGALLEQPVSRPITARKLRVVRLLNPQFNRHPMTRRAPVHWCG